MNVYPTAVVASEAVAGLIIERLREAVAARGRATLGLTGGRSPRALFQLLAQPENRDRLPWQRTHVMWSDERCVPADSPENNARLAHELLLDHVPLRQDHIHRVPPGMDPHQAATEYEADLRTLFADGEPRLDLLILGLGADGHVASLFPAHPALDERDRWAVGVRDDRHGPERVTLTLPVLNLARTTVLNVFGRQKGQALRQTLRASPGDPRWPAGLLAPVDGELRLVLDEEAARELGAAATG